MSERRAQLLSAKVAADEWFIPSSFPKLHKFGNVASKGLHKEEQNKFTKRNCLQKTWNPAPIDQLSNTLLTVLSWQLVVSLNLWELYKAILCWSKKWSKKWSGHDTKLSSNICYPTLLLSIVNKAFGADQEVLGSILTRGFSDEFILLLPFVGKIANFV